MQEWVVNNYFLMHSTHNDYKSVISEWFIKHHRLKSIK